MNCRKFRQQQIRENNAGGADASAARAHLQTCAACQGLTHAENSVAQMLGGLPRRDAPANFNLRLRARMNSVSAAPVERSIRRLFPVPVLASVLGGILLAVGFGVNALFSGAQSQSAKTNTPVATTSEGNGTQPVTRQETARKDELPAPRAETFPPTISGEPPATPSGRVALSNSPPRHVARVDAARYSPALTRARISEDSPVANISNGVRTIESSLNPAQVVSRNTPAEALMQLPMIQREPLRFTIQGRNRSVRYLEVAPITFGTQDFYRRAAAQPTTGVAENDLIW